MSLLKKMPLSQGSFDKVKAQEEACRDLLSVLSGEHALPNAQMYRLLKQAMYDFDPEGYRLLEDIPGG